MQAITTKYHGPGNVRGSRITATCDAGRVTVPYDHAHDRQANHQQAALALVRHLGWADHLARWGLWSGDLPGADTGMVHTFGTTPAAVIL